MITGRFFDLTGGLQQAAGGLLQPAIEAFNRGEQLNTLQIAAIKAYVLQWISAPNWIGPDIAELRARAKRLASTEAIEEWMAHARSCGICPP